MDHKDCYTETITVPQGTPEQGSLEPVEIAIREFYGVESRRIIDGGMSHMAILEANGIPTEIIDRMPLSKQRMVTDRIWEISGYPLPKKDASEGN